MSGDAISDGDIAMIRMQREAVLGDILAVRVDGEITLKRIRQVDDRIELLPSNREFSVRSVPAEQVEILGKLVGIVRKT
jgi:repressor LexA